VTLPDDELVAALRAGDEEAYAAVVREWHAGLLRVARIFTPTRAVAEEVVQETWLRVLGALDRFEGRSSLKTWVFRILVNTAKTRAQRESRPSMIRRASRRRRSTPTASCPTTIHIIRAVGSRRRASFPRTG
jgi:RNA polymerase sigma factor (sigma-70 family)